MDTPSTASPSGSPRRPVRVSYSSLGALRVGAALAALVLVVVLVNLFMASSKAPRRTSYGSGHGSPPVDERRGPRRAGHGGGRTPRRRDRAADSPTVPASVGGRGAALAGGVIGRWIMVDLLHLRVARLLVPPTFHLDNSFPAPAFLAAFAAVVAADAPWMSRRWRRGSRAALGLLLALRLFSGTTGLRELIVAVAVGWVVGSVVSLVIGTPERRPSEQAVSSALGRLGISASAVIHTRSAGGVTSTAPCVVVALL
ncbi:MAG: hypothetical protein R2698_11395 [Microthrixaceae bacterium]